MVNWDDATDKKFLLNIIHVLEPEKMNWPVIMASMGEEFTLDSVKSRYKKLKQQAKTQFGDAPTPTNSKAKAAKGEKSTGAKRKQKKGDTAEKDVYGDDDEEQTPSKKMKVKEEAAEESDDECV